MAGGALIGRSLDAGLRLEIATFEADVTPPLGHGMMGGLWRAKSVVDPLLARGFVVRGGPRPIVVVSVDWCEIRNDAYELWRSSLAEAAGTSKSHVLVSCIHQHEAPVADLEAQRILERAGSKASICDIAFVESAVKRVAEAVRASRAVELTHIGTGQARVEKVASNRRYVGSDGKVRHDRGSSAGKSPSAAAEEGTIDPWLKTLSFWSGEQAVAALSVYATHPMSYYRTGEMSADFPGMARAARQRATPGTLQIYASGCSGNVTAGKYNDASRANRPVLASRLETAMRQAWEQTTRRPVSGYAVRTAELRLEPRSDAGFSEAELAGKIAHDPKPWSHCLAAMGLSWRKRVAAGLGIDVVCVDFGAAQLVLLPGESYVEYQLMAQAARPGGFVVAMGYGESATGYVPTEQAWAEKDSNLTDWCWVAPGSEAKMRAAIEAVLKDNR
jgi:hypothetical protein